MGWEWEACLAADHCAQVWLLQTGWVPGPTPWQSLPASVSFLLHFTHHLSAASFPQQPFAIPPLAPGSPTGKPVPRTQPSVQGCCRIGVRCQWPLLGSNPSALELCSQAKQKTKQSCQKIWYLCCFPEGRVAQQAAGQRRSLWGAGERLFLLEGSGFYHVLLILQVC